MFVPIGDTPNPQNYRPWVNWTLIGLNVAIYLFISLPLSFQDVPPDHPVLLEYLRALYPDGNFPAALLSKMSAYDVFLFKNGFQPGAFEGRDLFTAMFLHGGFMHLAGNMLFLYIYGDNIEHRLGHGGYFLAYLGTGVAATLAFSLFSQDSLVPMVGASGAISGVLGLYFVFFPRNKVKMLFLFPFLANVSLWPARWVLGFYLIFENLIPALLSRSSNVAYGAHIGGFLGGLLLARAIERGGLGLFPGASSSASKDGNSTPLKVAVEQGAASQAIAALRQLGPKEAVAQLSAPEASQLSAWLQMAGQNQAAIQLLRSALIGFQRDPEASAEIHLALGELRLGQGQLTSAYQHLLTVLDLAPTSPAGQKAKVALRQIPVFRRA